MSQHVESHQIRSSDGVRLNMRVIDGSGPDLLICHATGFHGAVYLPLASCLSKSFRVWVLDFRGHGSSELSPTDDYRWRWMAEDVRACVETIGSDKSRQLYGFGHSMGGSALLLAEERHPGAFAGLFLYEPVVWPEARLSSTGGNALAASARRRREDFASRAAALARYAARPPLNVLRADALAAYVEHGFVDLPDGGVRLACRARTEALTYEGSSEMTIERLASVIVPTVVAAGSNKMHPDPAEFAPLVAATLPAGRLLRYQSLGHFGPLEAPANVAADIIRELLDAKSADNPAGTAFANSEARHIR